MKAILCILVALFACVQATDYGYARLVGGTNDTTIIGDVFFVVNGGVVRVYANISGITNRVGQMHGMHVHQYGDIADPTAAKTGAHYVGSGSSSHGCPPNAREEGDMGNWNVTSDGRIDETHDFDLLALTGDYSIIGRAVVLHFNMDDCTLMNSSSVRSARGVIGVGNPAYFPATALGITFSGSNTASNTGNLITPATKAVCYLYGTTGNNVNGTVTFETVTGGVLVTALISGLVSGSQHGIHVHAFGDLTLNTGVSIGDHFNPLNTSHGLPPNTTRHVGDMGSVCNYDNNGLAFYSYTNTLLTIGGNDLTANVIGRAVALHANYDSGSTTSYGSRIAQCVIGVANPTTTRPESGTLTTNLDVNCQASSTTTAAPTTTTAPPSSSASALAFSALLFVAALLSIAL